MLLTLARTVCLARNGSPSIVDVGMAPDPPDQTGTVLEILAIFAATLCAALKSRQALALENFALRTSWPFSGAQPDAHDLHSGTAFCGWSYGCSGPTGRTLSLSLLKTPNPFVRYELGHLRVRCALMMSILMALLAALRASCRSRVELQLELLALRQQIHVLERSRHSRTRLSRADRVFWVWLSRVWTGWRRPLIIVQPATVIAWHRQGFRWFWIWKSRRRTGRSPVPADVRALIRTMSDANPLWGAPRIHGELLKLGIAISQASVAKYMVRCRRPPSQTWRTFLTNHRDQLMAVDFFVVPTVTYRLLFVLVLLAHDRRRIVHLAVTAHPTAAWTAQQLREACPWESAPRYLIRDRDYAFEGLGITAKAMGIHEVLTAPGAPWQKDYASYCTSLV